MNWRLDVSSLTSRRIRPAWFKDLQYESASGSSLSLARYVHKCRGEYKYARIVRYLFVPVRSHKS